MHKIAIIQFPGINTEYETRREIKRAGMLGEFFRWNEPAARLQKYDGYVIGGGFSYEDRGRAGIIAALDPIMKAIKAEAEKGKPVLGICNGAQILVESGLIPGLDSSKLAMALARNKRMREGEILGTGYYNAWVNFKCAAEPEACMFTGNFQKGEIIHAPVAHAEGRFTSDIPNLIYELMEKGRIVFRYCAPSGAISENFPDNPNGASFAAAAICNPAGNVMAVMPHLERNFEASQKLFTSLRDALDQRKTGGLKKRASHLHSKPSSGWPLPSFVPLPKGFQMFISLIITDNEADTFEMTLKNLGFEKASLKRFTHMELGYAGKPDLQKTAKKLIQSGILLNTNKEWATVATAKEKLSFDAKREKFMPAPSRELAPYTFRLLVREKPDFVGLSKLATLQTRLKFSEITELRTGTLWEIHINTKSRRVAEEELKKIVSTHLFHNPHRQEALLM